ncbi:carbon-nitrogen hydrolase family protein [Abyssisolibacter fermentans]|uniref:carbon-nitrogen hydrolase family protein n=1 Tax=Abyssisolibacter fermentans TaxID=1766203 RepID=UPI000830CE87|nr:carbon-nitrogen hydrolase family protein [Abyssisolibacter fermentans]
MKVKIGVCQMKIEADKLLNLKTAERGINKAVKKGSDIVVLPEMFNCPYDNSVFRDYAENQNDSETLKFLSKQAQDNNVCIVGGSIPELDKGKIYNTSFVFDKNGEIIAKHRKVHLFDIDVKGGVRFKESDTLTAGNKITVFNTVFGKIGLCICYDIRFPELSRLMAQLGAKIIIIPAAFNMTTGPMHWEMLFKVRALDNQVFMVGAAPARSEEASYVAYGNSILTDPWGRVVNKLGSKEEVMVCEIDLSLINQVREQLPILKHRRLDIYELKSL